MLHFEVAILTERKSGVWGLGAAILGRPTLTGDGAIPTAGEPIKLPRKVHPGEIDFNALDRDVRNTTWHPHGQKHGQNRGMHQTSEVIIYMIDARILMKIRQNKVQGLISGNRV